MDSNPSQGQLSPDQVAASLAFANHLHKGLIGGNQAPPGPEDPQPKEMTHEEEQPDQKTENIKGEMHGKLAEQELKMTEGFNSKFDELKSDIEDLKKELQGESKDVQKSHKKDIDDIQKSLKDILNAK